MITKYNWGTCHCPSAKEYDLIWSLHNGACWDFLDYLFYAESWENPHYLSILKVKTAV